MLPLSSVLSVTMTQIVSTLASLLQGAWHPGCTPASQSALYPLFTDNLFPLDLLQQLVSLLAPDLATFLAVFSPLVQHCQQEAASTQLVSPKFQSLLLSLSKLMDVKTSSGSRPVAGSPLTTVLPTLAGGVVSLPSLGLFLFPTLLLEKDLAMADQFLKGETFTWCTIMVSPLRNWSTETGSFSRRRVGKRKRPREWRLKTSALPARDSKTVVRGDQEVGHWAGPRAGLHLHQPG